MGLIIVEDEEQIVVAEKLIKEHAFRMVGNWKELLQVLEQNRSVCYVLSHPLSKEMYDVIAQYSDRGGMIQIMDRETMILKTVKFNPTKARLLLISTNLNLKSIEQEYQIRNKAGLVEIID